MKKHYICAALATAGLASPWPPADAAALSGAEVQIYGVVDAGVAVTSVSGVGSQRHAQRRPDGFAVGLRGREDLGEGWSARFQLENGFDPSTGRQADDRSLFNYGAWVGLGHDDLGELRLGRQYTVGKTYGNALEIASWKEMGMGATFKASDNYQFSNLVNYYAGVAGLAGRDRLFLRCRRAGEIPHQRQQPRAEPGPEVRGWPVAGRGDLGPDEAGPAAAGHPGQPRALQLGASYDFEVLKVSAAWSRQRNGYVGLDGGDPDNLGQNLGPAAFAAGGTVNAWLLGVSVPLGRGTVLAQWSLAAGLAMGRWHDRAQGAADDAGVYLRAVEAHHGLCIRRLCVELHAGQPVRPRQFPYHPLRHGRDAPFLMPGGTLLRASTTIGGEQRPGAWRRAGLSRGLPDGMHGQS